MLAYPHPENPLETGRNFYGLLNPVYRGFWNEYMDSKEISFDDKIVYPQLVTAVSENHFIEHILHAKRTAATLKAEGKNRKLLIFDIGLSEETIEFFKSRPEIYIYRKFSFDGLPPSAKKPLYTMTWKVLLWSRCLTEFGACVWMDSSVYYNKSYDQSIKNDFYAKKKPYAYGIYASGNPTMRTTHPFMFSFFPSNMSYFEANQQQQSGGEVMFNTKEFKHGIMKYALACALTPECMYPKSKLNGNHKLAFGKDCHDYKNYKARFYNCHRFDQSLMDILVRNFYKNDPEKWSMDKEVLTCDRKYEYENYLKEVAKFHGVKYVDYYSVTYRQKVDYILDKHYGF